MQERTALTLVIIMTLLGGPGARDLEKKKSAFVFNRKPGCKHSRVLPVRQTHTTECLVCDLGAACAWSVDTCQVNW